MVVNEWRKSTRLGCSLLLIEYRGEPLLVCKPLLPGNKPDPSPQSEVDVVAGAFDDDEVALAARILDTTPAAIVAACRG